MDPKPREERKTILVGARLRTERGWSDVTIANASSRGLMLQSVAPLERNEFIEIRYRQTCIVGRIVWTGGARCGVRTQDAVDVAALLSHAPSKKRKPGTERRAAARLAASRPAAERTAEESRRLARAFDWAVVALCGSAAASFAARIAYAALEAPLLQVGVALAGNG
jgi:hypothetical protein